MSKNFARLIVALLVSAFALLQLRGDKTRAHELINQEQTNNRLIELLRHPTFITLRLLYSPNNPSSEQATDTPPPFTENDRISFQLFLTQNSSEKITIWNELIPYYQYRPELLRDGDAVAFSDKAQEGTKLADTQPPSGSSAPLILRPAHEYQTDVINLADWYDSLRPGRYQLIVRKRFVWNGDWVQSNPVVFEVRPRKPPQVLPNTVTIRLAPSGSQGPAVEQKGLRSDREARVAMYVENRSDQAIRIDVVDAVYTNRPQLFKDGALIPYLADVASLLRLMDVGAQRIEIVPEFVIDPHGTSLLGELNLRDFYGPLGPGRYKLTTRHRFSIGGSWTPESAPLLFEIIR